LLAFWRRNLRGQDRLTPAFRQKWHWFHWNVTRESFSNVDCSGSADASAGCVATASNRLTTTGTTASTETISTTNNRLNSTSGGIVRTYGYDSAGNTTSYTGDSFTFNDRGRMSQAIVSGSATNYIYNALGQLVEKYGNGGTTFLVYDEAGHILGEYSSTGALIEETVWMGDTPVATLLPNGSSVTIYYVHTDHLGTPRKVTRPSDNGLMWRWDPDTFGSVAPNSNPSGLGTFNYNLRFPGQYSLNESGLYYNYYRDYDPSMGWYLESDPIGLAAGVSTYTYVGGDPLSVVDPYGLLGLDDLYGCLQHDGRMDSVARPNRLHDGIRGCSIVEHHEFDSRCEWHQRSRQ
jgi:RHS repeat-associated protein